MGARLRAFGQSRKILSPGPAAREARGEEASSLFSSPGRTFISSANAAGDGGRNLEKNLTKTIHQLNQ